MMQRARYMIQGAAAEIRRARDSITSRLSKSVGAKRLREESYNRLAENKDFLDWQSDSLTPAIVYLRDKLSSPETVGYQNDIIKSVLRVLEPMDLHHMKKVLDRIQDEIRLAEKQLGG